MRTLHSCFSEDRRLPFSCGRGWEISDLRGVGGELMQDDIRRVLGDMSFDRAGRPSVGARALYRTEPDDPGRLVVNPAWRKLDKKVRAARAKLQKAEAAYGRVSLSNASPRKRDRIASEVAAARDVFERLCRQRRDTARKVPLGDISDGDPIKLTYERKLLTDTIKMCAYDVETQLFEMLDGVFCRKEFEGRAVIREILQTPGDLTLSPGQSTGELHIHLEQLSAPRYTEAMMLLCDRINAMDLTLLPAVKKRVILAV